MPQAKSFLTLIFLFAFAVTNFPQNPDESLSKIRAAMESNNPEELVLILSKLERQNPKLFSENNFDYLVARTSEKTGDFGVAIANYQKVVNRQSILKEYALWHLSQIMRNSGNLFMERLYLDELSTYSDESLLQDATQNRLIRSNMESGNFSVVISKLENPTGSKTRPDDKTEKQTPQNRKDLVMLGRAYSQNNQSEKAREIFEKLVNNLPNPNRPDDFALAGARNLDRLELGKDNFGKAATKLSVEDHLKRAGIYQFNRDFVGARLHFESIVKNYPDNGRVAISMFQIGRGFGQERDYENAAKWFERLLKEFPNDKFAPLALYNLASAQANLEQTENAVASYLRYINENPDAKNLERAPLNIIDAYRDSGEDQKALGWAARTQDTFRNEMGEAVALFSQIRIRISQEDWQNAFNDLNRLKEMKNLGGTRIAGGTNKKEVDFLRGFTLEKLGRYKEAIELYLSIPDGLREYYGWRATARLKKLASDSKSAAIVEQKLSRLKSIVEQTLTSSNADEVRIAAQNVQRISNPGDIRIQEKIKTAATLSEGYQRVPLRTLADTAFNKASKGSPVYPPALVEDALIFLGFFDEGTAEWETRLRKNRAKNTGSLSDFETPPAYSLSVFYKRGDIADRAIRFVEPFYRKIPSDYPVALIPREHLELLYPIPYQDSLVKYGKEKNVDPRFVLSIMRQESRFQANVKSVAAARGLMQFISNTSNKMAKEMEIQNFRQDDLYNPPTAIRFGSHYIANIFKDFPGKPAAVAASYNGGEDRMMRWYKRAKSDNPDRFVPEMIFSQTKDYAYKVMSNYRVYKMLYDENLNPINIRPTPNNVD